MVTEIQHRKVLETLVINFTEAFNREDIEAVMSYFSDDAVYEEFTGVENVGLSAIRKSLEPQFSGVFGKMRFHTEDMFIDTSKGKAMVRWLLTLEEEERAGAYRGLDFGRVNWVSGYPQEDPIERMYRTEYRNRYGDIYPHRPDPADFTRR